MKVGNGLLGGVFDFFKNRYGSSSRIEHTGEGEIFLISKKDCIVYLGRRKGSSFEELVVFKEKPMLTKWYCTGNKYATFLFKTGEKGVVFESNESTDEYRNVCILTDTNVAIIDLIHEIKRQVHTDFVYKSQNKLELIG